MKMSHTYNCNRLCVGISTRLPPYPSGRVLKGVNVGLNILVEASDISGVQYIPYEKCSSTRGTLRGHYTQ